MNAALAGRRDDSSQGFICSEVDAYSQGGQTVARIASSVTRLAYRRMVRRP